MPSRRHSPRPGPRRRNRENPARKGSRDRARRQPVHRRPRPAENAEARALHLSDDIVRELKSMARPGKGDILVKVFSEAAAAFADDDFDEAIRLGEQAKHIALRSAAVRELLGISYYRAEKWKNAARELAAFRRLSGTTEQNPVIADCYRATERPDKALEFCDEIDRAAVSEDIFYEGEIVAAGALADMKRLDDAIERLQVLDLNPEVAQERHLRAWYALGDLLERRGRFTQARDWFEAVAAADPELTDAPERAVRLRAK